MATKQQSLPMVDLIGQYQKIKDEVNELMNETLETCYFIGGPRVSSFAQKLEAYLDVAHVIPCGNGTDALQIALMALQLKPGDEVITTPFTFAATAEVIALMHLTPVFVDCHPDTFNIDETKLEAAITERSRCIIPVHLFGQCANMEPIMAIAKKHNLYVVEDNAQAIGSSYQFESGQSQKAGTIGHIGTTSFFPSKNLGAYGDGGALFTNDSQLAEQIKMICNHGMKVRYYHDEIGVNSRLDALQAAVLEVKLRYLNEYNSARREAAHRYNHLLQDVSNITVPFEASYSDHVYHQYTLKIEGDRDAVKTKLSEQGISSAIYYPVPLHLQKAYTPYGFKEGDFPVTEELAGKVLSLPMHTELDLGIQQTIINALKNTF